MRGRHTTVIIAVIGMVSTAVLLFAKDGWWSRPTIILFAPNSDKILPFYYETLNTIGKPLTSPQYSDARVWIEGHTDSIGSDGYNLRLSRRRAESVRRYLLQHFPVSPERLIAKGHGKNQPITTNETPEGRMRNRRVEIVWELTEEDIATGLFGGVRTRGIGPMVLSLPPIPRLSARELLIGHQREESGYGLYSYLLFASPPTAASRDRYLAAITAYLELIPARPEVELWIAPNRINLTYLPLRSVSPPQGKRIAAEWLLEHYNYTRARVLLSAAPGPHREGPYLISTLTPLGSTDQLSGPYLQQHLSRVPAPLVGLWVKEFLHQVEQERFWEESTVRQFALNLRTAIGILAEGLPEVRRAFAEWGSGQSTVREAVDQRIVVGP